MNKKMGVLKVYRIFDIAHEVLLDKAYEKLKSLTILKKFSLNRPSKNMLFQDPPLVVFLGEHSIENLKVAVTAKLWSYGALSFSVDIECPFFVDKKELIEWVENWSQGDSVENFCRERISFFIESLGESLVKPKIWEQSEEYSIFVTSPKYHNKDYWLEDSFVYQLLAMEKNVKLSPAMLAPVVDCTVSYGPDDLVAIDWDNAFVYSEVDGHDICDVIEFANIQLLELRYFDDLLDKKLSGLYRQVVEKNPSIFSKVSVLAKDASQLYFETSELVDRIENSVKVIGDIYYARLFRICLKRLQVEQWQSLVDQKLKNLLDVSQMYMAEVNNRKSHLMEIIIIILIAIEVIPFVYNLALKLM
ncbi:hypothetical protein ABMA79_02630 [Halobacteriovorax sp. HFRX-2_2]|uniref:hypothetical protein n=1 Tax=unclassified Halobacteriovorax TaxID=2639665 RepID=UPI00372294E4